MSECDTAAQARRNGSLLIRGAESADYGAIRDVVSAGYAQYGDVLGPDMIRVSSFTSHWLRIHNP